MCVVIHTQGQLMKGTKILKEIPSSAIAEPENPTLMEDLKENQCKFPLYEDCPPKYFCGRKQWKVPRKSSKYYCMYHVYIATKPKEKT